MIPCHIGNTIVNIRYKWDEITLSKANEFYTLCKRMPPKLMEMYSLMREEDNGNKLEQWYDSLSKGVSEFTDFYRNVLICLSDSGPELLHKVKGEDIDAIYFNYIHQLAFSILNHGAGHDSFDIEYFIHKGEFYYLPENKEVMDFVIPFEAISTIQFTEANDLFKMVTDHEEGYKYVGAVIASLCMKKGELFDQDVIMKRAQEFKDLPMDTVFNVFFCFLSSLIIPPLDSKIYFQDQEVMSKRLKDQALIKWVGMDRFLTWLGVRGI